MEISCIQASVRLENQYDDFVNVMQDSTSEHEILVPLSIMRVWKNDKKSIGDE